MTDIGNNITWTRKLENYFSSTGERANCMSWSHTEAEKIFSYRRTFIDLPVIVLSSVNGFLSVGSSSLFPGGGNTVSSALGAVSLFVAVLNTLGSYFSWAKRAEAHRIASIHYAKLFRFINVEMSLPREERTPPSEFLKYIKEQYDHLNEMSPPLPEQVIKSFHKMFNVESLKSISVPEQMNGLEAIHVYDAKDLKNDLDLDVETKTLAVAHAANIDNIPGRPELRPEIRSDFNRRDSTMSVLPPMPPKELSKLTTTLQTPQLVPQLDPQVFLPLEPLSVPRKIPDNDHTVVILENWSEDKPPVSKDLLFSKLSELPESPESSLNSSVTSSPMPAEARQAAAAEVAVRLEVEPMD